MVVSPGVLTEHGRITLMRAVALLSVGWEEAGSLLGTEHSLVSTALGQWIQCDQPQLYPVPSQSWLGSIPWPVNQTECPSPLKLLLFLNLITVTIKATNAGFNQSHSTHLKPYQSRNHFFCLCVISCVGKMSVSCSTIYNSLALFLYMPFFPRDWGFSFFLCFLSVCPCSQALIRGSSGFNCSLKPSTLTPNLHHSPSRDFRDTEEQEISIRQNIFWRLSDTVLTKSK